MRSTSYKEFERNYADLKKAVGEDAAGVSPYIGVAESGAMAIGLQLTKSGNPYAMAGGGLLVAIAATGVPEAIAKYINANRQERQVRTMTDFEQRVFVPYIQEVIAAAQAFSSKEWEAILSSITVGTEVAGTLGEHVVSHLYAAELGAETAWERITIHAMAQTICQLATESMPLLIRDAAVSLADTDLIMSCAAIKDGLFTSKMASFLAPKLLKSGDPRLGPIAKTAAVLIADLLSQAWDKGKTLTVYQAILFGNFLNEVSYESDLNYGKGK